MSADSSEALVREVEALFEDRPARGKSVRVTREGVVYFTVSARAIRCDGCGLSVPQPLTKRRQSPEARQQWVRDHERCSRAIG